MIIMEHAKLTPLDFPQKKDAEVRSHFMLSKGALYGEEVRGVTSQFTPGGRGIPTSWPGEYSHLTCHPGQVMLGHVIPHAVGLLQFPTDELSCVKES